MTNDKLARWRALNSQPTFSQLTRQERREWYQLQYELVTELAEENERLKVLIAERLGPIEDQLGIATIAECRCCNANNLAVFQIEHKPDCIWKELQP